MSEQARACIKESDNIRSVVQAMSRFYRLTLSKGKDIITIRDEVEMCNAYMEIQKRKYKGRICYEVEADEEILGYLIPKITLPPFLENATIFYYGVTGGVQLQTVLFVILFLLGLTFFTYVFAEMAKFENTVSGHFRMACVLMLRNPGWSAAILVISVLELFLIYFFVYFPVLFIMGIGGYMKAAVFDHIFRKLIDDGRIVEDRCFP